MSLKRLKWVTLSILLLTGVCIASLVGIGPKNDANAAGDYVVLA